MLARLKTYSRAAIVALTLGGAVVTAMPVQAAPGFSFEFSIGKDGPKFDRGCYSERELKSILRNNGYRVILFAERGEYAIARAEKQGKTYRVTIDRCRGKIVDRERVRF